MGKVELRAGEGADVSSMALNVRLRGYDLLEI